MNGSVSKGDFLKRIQDIIEEHLHDSVSGSGVVQSYVTDSVLKIRLVIPENRNVGYSTGFNYAIDTILEAVAGGPTAFATKVKIIIDSNHQDITKAAGEIVSLVLKIIADNNVEVGENTEDGYIQGYCKGLQFIRGIISNK